MTLLAKFNKLNKRERYNDHGWGRCCRYFFGRPIYC